MLKFPLAILVICASYASADELDAQLDDASVKCANDHMQVTFEYSGSDSSTGVIFVKGQFDDSDCKTDITQAGQTTYTVNYGTCGTADYNPSSGNTIVFIISFHDSDKLTKVDREVIATCTYDSTTFEIHNSVQVSDAVSTEETVTDDVPPPDCVMTIRLDDPGKPFPTGPVNVGTPMIAKMTCEPVADEWNNNYCSYIHSCVSTDENGENTCELTDEFGCTLDQTLMESAGYDYTSNVVGDGQVDVSVWGEMLFHAWTYVEQSGFTLTCTVTSYPLDNAIASDETCPTTCEQVESLLSPARKRSGPVVSYKISKKFSGVKGDQIEQMQIRSLA